METLELVAFNDNGTTYSTLSVDGIFTYDTQYGKIPIVQSVFETLDGGSYSYGNDLKKAIPFVVIIGSDEIKSGLFTLKNMISGEQKKLSIEEILNELK